ncbi:MAG: hypothetical protein AUG51_11960 [Acidobacteria bacterium 13_1_20CM_3_53_8]|nr:MAG: hypothetical protein AUG51_11960 [Acidobacteria bacterium 13_1_20CM_3_53_8]
MKEEKAGNARPFINVTPLIDVLLVLLIIFMVASPLKPARFETKIPSEPDTHLQGVEPNPLALVVTITPDLQLRLNNISDMGSVNDTSRLSAKLAEVFQQRVENRAYRYGMETRDDLSYEERIERTVFIKAPRSIPYGDVVKVIDGVKGAGAKPVGLQIDDLD